MVRPANWKRKRMELLRLNSINDRWVLSISWFYIVQFPENVNRKIFSSYIYIIFMRSQCDASCMKWKMFSSYFLITFIPSQNDTTRIKWNRLPLHSKQRKDSASSVTIFLKVDIGVNKATCLQTIYELYF